MNKWQELEAAAISAPKGRWDVGRYYIWRGNDKWHPGTMRAG